MKMANDWHCVEKFGHKDDKLLVSDLGHFQDALRTVGEKYASPPADTFTTAVSPGMISFFIQNDFYPSHKAFFSSGRDHEAGVQGDPQGRAHDPDRLPGSRDGLPHKGHPSVALLQRVCTDAMRCVLRGR